MEINLGGLDAAVAEKVLEFMDGMATHQHGGGETVAQCVGAYAFAEACALGCGFECFAQGVLVQVVSADDLGAWICAESCGWKEPEPWPFCAGVGVFAL